jgi:hypothetical protein
MKSSSSRKQEPVQAAKSTSLPNLTNPGPQDVGAWVRWYKNGWRHGWLKSVGVKKVVVVHLGKYKTLPKSEVFLYDPHSLNPHPKP